MSDEGAVRGLGSWAARSITLPYVIGILVGTISLVLTGAFWVFTQDQSTGDVLTLQEQVLEIETNKASGETVDDVTTRLRRWIDRSEGHEEGIEELIREFQNQLHDLDSRVDVIEMLLKKEGIFP